MESVKVKMNHSWLEARRWEGTGQGGNGEGHPDAGGLCLGPGFRPPLSRPQMLN